MGHPAVPFTLGSVEVSVNLMMLGTVKLSVKLICLKVRFAHFPVHAGFLGQENRQLG